MATSATGPMGTDRQRRVSLELASQYMFAAEQIAAAAEVAKLLPCHPSKSDASQCAMQFISTFATDIEVYRFYCDIARTENRPTLRSAAGGDDIRERRTDRH